MDGVLSVKDRSVITAVDPARIKRNLVSVLSFHGMMKINEMIDYTSEVFK
jgi:hypothetical protein